MMPTELGEPFEITWRGYPQQMLREDGPLWHKFLDKYGSLFSRFFFNVRVGGADLSDIDMDEGMKRVWGWVTAKRIDAIGERESEIWIIEVATAPYMMCVGQCLSYPFLWNLDRKIKKPARMVLVCTHLDVDLEGVLRFYKVDIIKL